MVRPEELDEVRRLLLDERRLLDLRVLLRLELDVRLRDSILFWIEVSEIFQRNLFGWTCCLTVGALKCTDGGSSGAGHP